MKVFNNQGGPFEEDSGDLLVLDTVIHNISNDLKIAEKQYHTFVSDPLVKRSTWVMELIHTNYYYAPV